MKRLLLALALLSGLTLSACDFRYTEIEYNNLFVEAISPMTESFKSAAETYNDGIPEKINELIQIETADMQITYEEALLQIKPIEELYTYEARNIEQQKQAQDALKNYQDASETYLEKYQQMLTYYQTDAYKEDITQVDPLDKDLHTTYTSVLETHNTLVYTLETYL
jgi:Txe/YoeB family toxin of Txe-Axe toxin-antitoxin module